MSSCPQAPRASVLPGTRFAPRSARLVRALARSFGEGLVACGERAVRTPVLIRVEDSWTSR